MIRSLSRRSRSAAASRRASGELGEACALVDPALLVEREPRAGPALEALARDAPADELAGERLDCAGADVVFGLGVDSNCHAQAASPSPPSNIDRGQQHPTRQSLLIAFLLARLTPAFPSSRTALTREAHACPCRTGRRRRRSLVGEGDSRQGPTGTDMLTSAFAESTRARRPAAAAYPGPDGGRLLAVGSERSLQPAEMTKASAGVVEAGARMRGIAVTPSREAARSHSRGGSRGDGGCWTGPLARYRLAPRRREITFGRQGTSRLCP